MEREKNIVYRDFHDFDTVLTGDVSDETFCAAAGNKTDDKWIPFLSFPITQVCNFHCLYCGIGGEAAASSDTQINPEKIQHLVKIAVAKGVRKFRITGGEPFAHKKIDRILDIFKNWGYFTLINTNGSLVTKYADIIKTLDRNFKFAVSLDTLKSERLKKISGDDNHSDVIEGIRLLSKYDLLLRINMVVINLNIDEVYDIISFCQELRCDLKLLDVVSVPTPFANRQSIYQEISTLEKELAQNCDEILAHEYTRGFGTPCRRYRFGNTAVTVKNSVKGSHYDIKGKNPVCKGCPYFPCHEGLYDMFALADGRICSCRWTERQVSQDSFEQMDYLIKAFRKSVYVKKKNNMDMKVR